MKIIVVYLDEKYEIAFIDATKTNLLDISSDRILHVIVVDKRMRKIKDYGDSDSSTGLRLNCAFHLDHCLNSIVETIGRLPFILPIDKEGIIDYVETVLSNYEEEGFETIFHSASYHLKLCANPQHCEHHEYIQKYYNYLTE